MLGWDSWDGPVVIQELHEATEQRHRRAAITSIIRRSIYSIMDYYGEGVSDEEIAQCVVSDMHIQEASYVGLIAREIAVYRYNLRRAQ